MIRKIEIRLCSFNSSLVVQKALLSVKLDGEELLNLDLDNENLCLPLNYLYVAEEGGL